MMKALIKQIIIPVLAGFILTNLCSTADAQRGAVHGSGRTHARSESNHVAVDSRK